MTVDLVPIRRALISVSDKTGLVELAGRAGRARGRAGLDRRHGGGAARRPACRCATSRALTDFPEMLDGRVKTLHPMVHGGLLAVRDDPEHAAALDELRHRADRPRWSSTSTRSRRRSRPGADYDDCVENIDIGGPAMLRAAAKNHAFVDGRDRRRGLCARSSPSSSATGGATGLAFRRALALTAFGRTAAYDAAVSALARRGARRGGAAAARASPARWPRRCATARTRTRARPSTATARAGPASRRRGSCRARS